MNCPHCQKELSEDGALILCPACGGTLPKISGAFKEFGVLLGRIFLVLIVIIGIALAIMAVIFAGCVLCNGGKF